MIKCYDYCVLFLYHKCDNLTRSHLEVLQRSNPNAKIVPLTDSVPELLPDSVDVNVFNTDFHPAPKWRSIDTTLYKWFKNRSIDARKYIVIEYDCFCTIDLQKFYSEVWDSDVTAVDLFTQEENPKWKWFMNSEIGKLPPADRQFAAGIVPFTCTAFSHSALEAIVASTYRSDVFCELRLGTTIKKLGLNFKRLPVPQRSTICYHGYPWQITRPGLFHSVKTLDHNSGKQRQPGPIRTRFHDWARSLTRDREFLPFHLSGKWAGLKRRLSE